MRAVFVLTLCLAVTACGVPTTYTAPVTKASSGVLDPQQKVLISTPANGSYGGREYANSGRMTADIVRSAFSRVGSRADVDGSCKLEACLQQARASGHGYFVEPEILRWEDRATEWSGISDKVEIKLTVFDVATRQQVSSQIIAGNSSIWTLGGDHPQDMLPKPVGAYVAGLYN